MIQLFDEVTAKDANLFKVQYDTELTDGIVIDIKKGCLTIMSTRGSFGGCTAEAPVAAFEFVKHWKPEALFDCKCPELNIFAKGYVLKNLPFRTKTYLVEDARPDNPRVLLAIRNVRCSAKRTSVLSDVVSANGNVQTWRYGRGTSPECFDFATLREATQEELLTANSKSTRMSAFNREAPAVIDTLGRVGFITDDLLQQARTSQDALARLISMKGLLSGEFERSSDLRSEIKQRIPELVQQSKIVDTVAFLEKQVQVLIDSIDSSMSELKRKHNIPV